MAGGRGGNHGAFVGERQSERGVAVTTDDDSLSDRERERLEDRAHSHLQEY